MESCRRSPVRRSLSARTKKPVRFPHGPFAIVGILAVLAAAGCEAAQDGLDPSQLLPTFNDLITFVEDFARQALAAFLF